jgi:hypothetical protein
MKLKRKLVTISLLIGGMLLIGWISSCKVFKGRSTQLDTLATVDRITEIPITPELKAAFEINPVVLIGDTRIIKTGENTAIKTDKVPVLAKHTKETTHVPTKIKTINKDKSKVKTEVSTKNKNKPVMKSKVNQQLLPWYGWIILIVCLVILFVVFKYFRLI